MICTMWVWYIQLGMCYVFYDMDFLIFNLYNAFYNVCFLFYNRYNLLYNVFFEEHDVYFVLYTCICVTYFVCHILDYKKYVIDTVCTVLYKAHSMLYDSLSIFACFV